MRPWASSNDGVPELQKTRRHAPAWRNALTDGRANRPPVTDAFATDDSNPDSTKAAASDAVHLGR